MGMLPDDIDAILSWPLCHPGETAILPDRSVVLLQHIVEQHCKLGPQKLDYVALDVLQYWFRDTVRSIPIEHDDLVFSHPVLVMIKSDGGFVGLDGRARVDLGGKTKKPELPVIFVQEAEVRRLGQFDLQFLFEDEPTAADKAAYREAELIKSLHAHRTKSRPWMKEAAKQLELAFGAGSADGNRFGRPYLHIRPDPRIQKGERSAGRKSIPDIEKIDAGIAAVLARIRNILAQNNQPRALSTIIHDLTNGWVRCSADAKEFYSLIVSIPTLTELEALLPQHSNKPVSGVVRPSGLVIQGVDTCYSHDQIIPLILMLRDLGSLRLRVKEFDVARNALRRQAERSQEVSPEHYDRMLFDRSRRPMFRPLEPCLSIPGLIDPTAVAALTGVIPCHYHADFLTTLPMARVSAIRGEYHRDVDPIVDLATAITYLQYRAYAELQSRGGANLWLYWALRQDKQFADILDYAALAAVSQGRPVFMSESKAEIQRAMARIRNRGELHAL